MDFLNLSHQNNILGSIHLRIEYTYTCRFTLPYTKCLCNFLYSKMYARRTRSFFQNKNARMNKPNFTTEKSCSVHMTVFEIVVHRNVDNWIELLT